MTVVISYSLIFFIPKSIEFSYAQSTCSKQLLLAPDLQKFSSPDFNATFKGGIHMGNVHFLTTEVCVEPKETPKSGTFTASIAPFGGFVASKPVIITVPKTPVARSSDIVGKQISTAEPLQIQLTAADVVHGYSLQIDDKTTNCAQKASKLSCNVIALGLAQGTMYTASLHQTYKQTDTTILEGQVETLKPITMTSATISNDQTFYDKPTSFSFTFDQPIESGEVTISKIVGDSVEKIALTQEVSEATLKINFADLGREAKYRLEINQAIGTNGSSLAVPIAINFTTSGGPKVTSVSAGSNSVSRSARIIVSFDQSIDAGVDIAKYARITGLSGSVKRQSDTQLAFTIQGGDCTAFSLVVDKGIKSGSNGELSKEAWKFDSRTICGSSWVIGSSLKGRAITAYSFGSGSKTILLTGGMHGSEPSGYTTMQAWVKYLQSYGDSIPADKRVVIVPNTNPDGIAAGSRNNSRNVNIDRNFPTANWQASIETTSGTLPTGGGTSAGSEPETAALMALTRQLRPRVEVSFHAQGRLVGANKFSDSVSIGDVYAKTVGYKTMYYDAEAVMGYPMTGEFEDWMGEEMNIPAILIELPSASGNYLNAQLPALKKMLSL
ncbi:MAG: M14 family metallopeptidase [Candidatus Saccharimonadaceae bacterium]